MCYFRAACPGGPVAVVPSVQGVTMHGGTRNTPTAFPHTKRDPEIN